MYFCAFSGIKNVVFFFSALVTQEKRKAKSKAKAKGKEEDEDSDESNDETVTSSQVASTTSQEWIAEHRSIVDKRLCPAVVYWIALTTPNGAPANPLTVHRALHECGVETLAHQVRKILS